MNRYNWNEIRGEYAAGGDEITLAVLRAKYGCAMSTIKNHSRREDWDSDRRHFRDQVRTKTQDLATTAEAEVRAQHLALARDLIAPALERLKRMKPDELSVTELRLYLKDACEIERRASGIPEAHEIDGIIKIGLAKEVEAFVLLLEAKLPPDVMAQVVEVIIDCP